MRRSMKLFAASCLVASLLVAVQTLSYLTDMERYQRQFDEVWLPACVAQTNAPLDVVRGNAFSASNASQEVKCCVECLYEKEGIVINGAVMRGKMADLARKLDFPDLQNLLHVISICEDEVADSSEKCVTGPRLAECFRKRTGP